MGFNKAGDILRSRKKVNKGMPGLLVLRADLRPEKFLELAGHTMEGMQWKRVLADEILRKVKARTIPS